MMCRYNDIVQGQSCAGLRPAVPCTGASGGDVLASTSYGETFNGGAEPSTGRTGAWCLCWWY